MLTTILVVTHANVPIKWILIRGDSRVPAWSDQCVTGSRPDRRRSASNCEYADSKLGVSRDLPSSQHRLGCVAATLRDDYGAPLATITISGPTIRVTDEHLPELAAQVFRAADEITVALGGKPNSDSAYLSGYTDEN
tara:strand:+ start:327 stop:737 length:411 start_codon:yes stop_codon:yes gene_type:complete